MDEAIVSGRGGFQTRAELMQEAVENLLNELDYPDADLEQLVPAADTGALADSRAATKQASVAAPISDLATGLAAWEVDELTLADLAGTRLRAPDRVPHLVRGGNAETRDEPLLGLHNRDYVSLWSLHRMARYTLDGPISFDEYLERATKAAWYYGQQLHSLELANADNAGRKLTVLFPTNASKRPSAERGFQSFAIGGLAKKPSRGVQMLASGPLFAWRAIQTTDGQSDAVAITKEGWRLLQELDGISLELPHAPELTARFMAYLAEHAPADRWGFDHLIRALQDAPNRDGLVAAFNAAHSEWSTSTASSVAQGYVARSREWGLVEPRLVEGRYWLTDAGREFLLDLDRSN
jgi:hypothetical protein